MTFDIVIPTFKREGKLIRLLNSIPKIDDYKIWIYFDNNDFSTAMPFASMYCSTVMNKKYQAFGIWNYHLQSLTSDIIVFICDDTELYADTLINIEKHFIEKFPDTDGIVTFKQANMKGTDSAMGCIGRKFASRYPNNQAFCPDYISFYADTEIGDYAKKLGKFHYGEDCLINHFHPISGVAMDATHHIIRGVDKTIDIKVNKIRKEKGLIWGDSFQLVGRNV